MSQFRVHMSTIVGCVSALILLSAATARAIVDCNHNGVADATDIANHTSQDCNLNGVPDECEGDFDGNGIIDGCDQCGDQLTDNNKNEAFGPRQKNTAGGRAIWFDEDSTIFYYDGVNVSPLQAKDSGDPTLGDVTNTVFALGSGASDGDVIGGWRRGTDFGWVWRNNGSPPVLVQYTSPYHAGDAMNPEGVAVGDGCLFMLLQAFDAGTNVLIKHVYKIAPGSGQSTLLTGDFLGDTQNGGLGAYATSFVTSQCKAAWAWCGSVTSVSCDPPDLHYYDGVSVSVIDHDAVPTSFDKGRLIYLKNTGGRKQVFLYDTNVSPPTTTQLTSYGSADPDVIFAATDGSHVAILRGDSSGHNRDIVTLGDFVLTQGVTQPSDAPANFNAPIQLSRGQLMWDAENHSTFVFDGRHTSTLCSLGWLADGHASFARKTDANQTDAEMFMKAIAGAADASVPGAPWAVTAEASGNGEATLRWESILGADSYNVYLATQAGVTKDAASFANGRTVSGVTSASAVVGGLSGYQVWYFVVTAVRGAMESAVSVEASTTPCLDATADRDGDGIPDCQDHCPDDAGKTEPGACGCGNSDVDANGNGTADCLDSSAGDAASAQAAPACGAGCGSGSPIALGSFLLLYFSGNWRRAKLVRRRRTRCSEH